MTALTSSSNPYETIYYAASDQAELSQLSGLGEAMYDDQTDLEMLNDFNVRTE